MSFIINPLGYRLTKTKYSKYCWVSLSKLNYKKNLFEDKNLEKFILWFKFFLNWIGLNISILNFNIIKIYKFLQINIKILIRKKNFLKKRKKKKKNALIFNNINKIFKNNLYFKYSLFFKKYLYYNFIKRKKKNKKNIIKFFKRKKIRKKKRKIFFKYFLNFLVYNKFLKKKKKRSIYSKFFFYNINLINFNKVFFLNYFYKKKKKKNFLKYFFFFMKSLLLFFLNNIFYNKKVIINFLNQNEFYNSSESLSNFIKMRVFQKYKVLHIVNLLFNNLLKKNGIIGIEIGLFGRYQKKLRNRKVWKMKGMISPSNINSPISYKNFVVLLRFGICGVKLYLLMKVYKNEIF